jgi:hypothetical protein
MMTLVSISALAGFPLAVIQFASTRLGVTKTCFCICRSPHLFRALHRLWSTRIAREVIAGILHTPLGPTLQSAISQEPGRPEFRSGCVLAVFHSPWGRLVAFWASRSNGTMLVASGGWASRIAIFQSRPGIGGIRTLLAALEEGRDIAVPADVRVHNHGVSIPFAGRTVMVSALPARLAAVAQVPLVPVIFRLTSSSVQVHFGPALQVGRTPASLRTATAELFTYYEAHVITDPSICSNVFRHRCVAGD